MGALAPRHQIFRRPKATELLVGPSENRPAVTETGILEVSAEIFASEQPDRDARATVKTVLPTCLPKADAPACISSRGPTLVSGRKPSSRAQRKPLPNKAKTLFRRGLKAERSGFEPEMPVSRHTGLAIRRFRPLSHLSGVECGEVSGRPGQRADYSRNPRQIQGQLGVVSASGRKSFQSVRGKSASTDHFARWLGK